MKQSDYLESIIREKFNRWKLNNLLDKTEKQFIKVYNPIIIEDLLNLSIELDIYQEVLEVLEQGYVDKNNSQDPFISLDSNELQIIYLSNKVHAIRTKIVDFFVDALNLIFAEYNTFLSAHKTDNNTEVRISYPEEAPNFNVLFNSVDFMEKLISTNNIWVKRLISNYNAVYRDIQKVKIAKKKLI